MNKKESYHFVGIGGIGMSALAHILLEKEHEVSGSDLSLSETVVHLQKKGARILAHKEVGHISAETTVVYSSAIREDHPELQEAKKNRCALLHRSELLAQLASSSQLVAVAGTHGKTTTTSLLASVLLHAQREISFAIGGYLKAYGTNGRLGQDPLFVIEADESDRSFLRFSPAGAIVTNVEEEHMESYGSRGNLDEAFSTFMQQVQEEKWLFYCGDDPSLTRLAKGRGRSYGFSQECAICITSYRQEGWYFFMDLSIEGKKYSAIKVPLIGRHNALNSAAVFACALALGLSEAEVRAGLLSFEGVKRRVEKRAEDERFLLLDDYAHHPTEIKCTLRAIKQAIGSRRLLVYFQPHRFTRTQHLWDEFVCAFEDADLLFVTEIYGASEKPIAEITAERLVADMRQRTRTLVEYLPIADGVERLAQVIRPQDVVVTLGAGNITSFHDRFYAHLQTHGVTKLKVGLIFGGKSVEHEISRRSAAYVAESLTPMLYDIRFFAIDKEGRWQMGARAEEMLQDTEKKISFEGDDLFFSDKLRDVMQEMDLFFPVIHGPMGEDGTLQGLFEMWQKAYVGPNHLSAAIGMDKVMTKRLLQVAHVHTPTYVAFDRESWQQERGEFLQQIEETLSYPLYVKPSHLGSSVGIAKIEKKEFLIAAIENAFLFDYEVLVEEAILDARELEFSVMGKGEKCMVTHPGEKLAQGSFVDYQMKYSSASIPTVPYADLPVEVAERGRELARKIYHTLGGSGMMRVDFLLDKENTFWCFEVNPIPGMTKKSLFPKMWERAGLPAKELFNQLIAFGLARGRQSKKMYV